MIDLNPMNWAMAAFQGVAEKATDELEDANAMAQKKLKQAQAAMPVMPRPPRPPRTRERIVTVIKEKKDSAVDIAVKYVLPGAAIAIGIAVGTAVLTRRN